MKRRPGVERRRRRLAITEAQFKKEYEAVLQKAINSGEEIVDMTGIVNLLNGAINVKTNKMFDWAEKILERINRGAENGNIGRVNISTFAGGSWDNAVGRYFEWCVYEELLNLVKKHFPSLDVNKDDATPVPTLAFSLQRFSMKFFKDFTTNKYVKQAEQDILITAKEAARILEENVGIEMCQTILATVAGSNPTGDLLLGNCILELKYYSNPNRIRWFTFTDEQFQKRFKDFIKGLNNDQLWDQDKKYLPQYKWVANVRSTGLEEYMSYVLNNEFSQSEQALFNYLLHKGSYNIQGNKRIIIGRNILYTGGKLQVSLTQDIDTLMEIIREKQWRSYLEGTKYVFAAAGEPMGDIEVPEKQIVQQSATRRKKGKVPKWDTTTFNFYLQKGFYNPGILTK